MSFESLLAQGPSPNGKSHAGRAPEGYLVALRNDPALARCSATCLPLTLLTPLGPTDALTAVQEAQRLVLVAPSGAGKTTILNTALHHLAQAPEGRCPVYVDLASARGGDGLEELVAAALSAAGAPGLSLAALGPSVLLLDNLDQATDVYLLEGLELFLRAGGQAGPGVVLACRSGDWPAYESWLDEVPVGELQPLAAQAVTESLHRLLPALAASSAERWLARDRDLASAARSPQFLQVFCNTVRDRAPDRWRRAQVLDAYLDTLLAAVPSGQRAAYRLALGDIALGGLGQGPLVEVDTVAMGLGVSRDDLIRSGVVEARGPALRFLQPLLAQHCAAMALAERGATEPGQLAQRLGDLSDPRRVETLVHVFHLAADPVAFILGLLSVAGGPELAARCLAEPEAADPSGPSGAGAVVGALCESQPPLLAPVLYRLGEALVRSGEPGAAEIALRAALNRGDDVAPLEGIFHRPDVDAPPPVDDWVREFLHQRNQGLALRGIRSSEASKSALGEAARALGRLDADLTFERGLTAADQGDLVTARVAFETAVAAEPDRARYVYHLGRTLLATGHPAEAIGYLQRARDLAPNQAEVEAALGEAYRAQEWIEEALMSFEAAARLAPGEASYQQVAAELQAEMGDLAAAATRMAHAVARRPEEPTWLDALGQVLSELGRWPAAVRAFRSAVDLDPGAAAILCRLGAAQLAAGEAAAAVDTLRRATALARGEALGHASLARALTAIGARDEAINSLARAIALDPSWPADHVLLARLYRESDDLEKALAASLEAVRLAPSSAAAVAERGRVHEARGEHREALADFERAMVQAPEQFEYRRYIATARQALGDTDGALHELFQSPGIAMSPSDLAHLAHLAQLLEDRGDVDAAADAWQQAIALAPEVAEYRKRAGELCLSLGREGEAVGHLTALVGLMPDDGEAQTLLARALRIAGDDERALGVLRRASRLLAQEPEVQAELARTALALGRVNEARSAVDLSLALAPDRADLYALKAEIELAMGEKDSARSCLERAVELDPDTRAYGLRLADLYQAQDGEAARRLLEDLAIHGPEADVNARLAAMHGAAGAWGRAADAYASARSARPQDPALALAHGAALRQAGRMEEAAEVLAAVVGMDGFGPDTDQAERLAATSELAHTYEALGQIESALTLYAESGRQEGASAELLLAWSRLALGRGALDEAIEAAQLAVSAQPDLPEAYVALAGAFEARGLLDAAHTASRRAADLAPTQADYRANEARLAYELGHYEEAISALEEGIASAPGLASLHFALGRAYDARGWSAEARAALARAADLAPDNTVYRRSLAALLTDVDPERALESLHQAVALDPDDAESYFQLGRLHLRRSDPEMALVQLQRAVRLRPDEAVYQRLLGETLAHLGRPGAIETLQVSLDLQPADPVTLAALARVYAGEGRHPAALDALAAATRMDPENADYWLQLGTLRMAGEDLPGAVEALRRAMSLDPDKAEGATALALGLDRLGQANEAADWYNVAARLAADNPASHVQLGASRLAAGDALGATKALERALALRPEDALALRLMAEAKLGAGAAEAAVAYAQRAVAAADDAAAWRCLAMAQRSTGDLAAAGVALERALELGPENLAVLRLRVEVAEEQGDVAGAREALRAILALDPGDAAATLHFADRVAEEGWRMKFVVPHPPPPVTVVDAALAEKLLTGLASGPRGGVAVTALRRLAEIRGRAGNVAAAVTAAEAAAAQDEGPDCLLLLAWVRLLAQDAVGALEAIGLARALGADGADVHMLAGVAYAARGESALATEAYRLAVAGAPGLAEAHAGLARACEAIGRGGEALAAYREAVALDAREDWQQAIGRLALSMGETDTALQILQDQVCRDPADAEARHGLAQARHAAGDLAGATSTLLQAVTLDPARAGWQAELAEMHRAQGHLEEARACYGRALALAPDNSGYRIADGRLALDLGQTDEARAASLAVLESNPRSPGAQLLLGRVALATGDSALALAELQMAAELDAANGEIQYWLGMSALTAGDAPAALRHLEAAARLPGAEAATYAALGELYQDSGHLDDAIQAYEQAVQQDPSSMELELRLGSAYQAAGLIDAAVAHYQRAADLAPADPRPRHAMGQAHLAAKSPEEAAVELEAAMALEPNAVGVYLDAGQAYKELRDYGRAAEMFGRAVKLQPANATTYGKLAAVTALQIVYGSSSERLDV